MNTVYLRFNKASRHDPVDHVTMARSQFDKATLGQLQKCKFSKGDEITVYLVDGHNMETPVRFYCNREKAQTFYTKEWPMWVEPEVGLPVEWEVSRIVVYGLVKFVLINVPLGITILA